MKKNIKKQHVSAAPVTIDDIDVANNDLRFIKAILDVISGIDGHMHLDELHSGTMGSLCATARDKVDGLEKFIESVHASTLRPVKAA